MEERDFKRLLHGANLRVTKARKDVLDILAQAGDQAVSSSDIEDHLHSIDRITLYRILKTYEESGLIHSIADGTGKTKYALCSPDCNGGHHHDNHVHFYCRKCETTTCLDALIPADITLPQDYLVEEMQFVVSGVCQDCR